MLLAILEKAQRYRTLTIYPIVSSDGPQLPYLLLSEALTSGVVSMEMAEGEDASILVARNSGFYPVVVLDRERLLGARRECMTDRSLLLGPRTVTELPLSRLEKGRWNSPPRSGELESGLRAFPRVENQVGALAFLGRRFLGLDAMGSPNLYAPLHRRLLTGYVRESLSAGDGGTTRLDENPPEAMIFAEALQTATREPCSTVGHGEQWLLSGSIDGRELCYDGYLVHLAVYPK